MREGMTMESTKMCVVYILHSASTERYYTGHTSDLDRRLREHNAGVTPSNRGGMPWSIVWKSEGMSRGEAMKLERRIKTRGAGRYLEDDQLTG